MSGPRSCLLVVVLAVLAACGRETPAAVPTAEEQHLFKLLTMDPFIEVLEYERDVQGRLVVTTRQGSTHPRYLFAAAPGAQMSIHRLDEEPCLRVVDDGTKGTGPEPRGLH